MASVDDAINGAVSAVADAILNPVIKLMFAVAFLYFVWGVFQYVRNADNEEARAVGTRHMTWGVIGLAVMTTAQAIVSLIGDSVQ